MDRLKKDLEHIRADGIDSGALYKRVCKYLSELLSYMATGLTPEEVAKLQTEVDFDRLKEIWGETPAKVEFGVSFDRLRELLQAERDGRLVVLPCKVGDTVYEIDHPDYGIIVCKVLRIDGYIGPMAHVPGNPMVSALSVGVEVVEGHGVGSSYAFEIEDFGKTVFLARPEAEVALEQLKGGGGT